MKEKFLASSSENEAKKSVTGHEEIKQAPVELEGKKSELEKVNNEAPEEKWEEAEDKEKGLQEFNVGDEVFYNGEIWKVFMSSKPQTIEVPDWDKDPYGNVRKKTRVQRTMTIVKLTGANSREWRGVDPRNCEKVTPELDGKKSELERVNVESPEEKWEEAEDKEKGLQEFNVGDEVFYNGEIWKVFISNKPQTIEVPDWDKDPYGNVRKKTRVQSTLTIDKLTGPFGLVRESRGVNPRNCEKVTPELRKKWKDMRKDIKL